MPPGPNVVPDSSTKIIIPKAGKNLMCDRQDYYRFEENRGQTFSNWPAEAPVAADRIARAGFYYTGENLTVKCFSCSKTIATWNFGDQVSQRHAALNPDCDFVKHRSNNVPKIKQQATMSPIDTMRQPSSTASSSSSGYGQMQAAVSGKNGYTIHPPSTAEEKTWDSFRSLLSEAERLRTFKGWTVAYVKVDELARAGFFFLKDGDRVQCIFCKVIISEWEEGDIPITEHHRHSPTCRFIKGFEVGNVPLGDVDPVERAEEAPGDDVAGRFQYEMEMFSGPENGRNNSNHINALNLENVHLGNLGITRHSGPRHPNYATQEARLRTFKDWPRSIPQVPEKLVEAGFYYAGVSDHTRCFYCDGGLRNWEPTDDPWIEHARWFGACCFLLLVKGHEFVSMAKSDRPPHLPESSNENFSVGVRNIYSEEINNLMECSLVKVVIDLGMPLNVVRLALEKELQSKGVPFSNPDELYDACEKVQNESSRNGMVKSVNHLGRVPNGVTTHYANQVNGTTTLPTSMSAPSLHSSFTQGPAKVGEKTEAMALMEENQRLKEMQLCKICMAEEVGVVFLPCGHLITCPKCAPCVTECPLCRRTIAHTVRTYLS